MQRSSTFDQFYSYDGANPVPGKFMRFTPEIREDQGG